MRARKKTTINVYLELIELWRRPTKGCFWVQKVVMNLYESLTFNNENRGITKDVTNIPGRGTEDGLIPPFPLPPKKGNGTQSIMVEQRTQPGPGTKGK
ncbi:hypothetical protein SESBI_25803 [Sesbania bispinosa]|nr:hypothetical protein SESBI_25803 [Sesbania bispinosa]